MPHFRSRLVVGFLALGLTFASACHLRANQEMRVIVPKSGWEPIFFSSINLAAKLAGQADLRKTQLPKGDVEVRIWWGFGLSPLEGVTLRRSSGQWSAIRVTTDNYYEPTKADRKQLTDPKSGWQTIWTRMVNDGLLSLPDSSEINCHGLVLDGWSYVVETNADSTYRTYMYQMSSEPRCNEAKRMMEICDMIFEEFNLNSQ